MYFLNKYTIVMLIGDLWHVLCATLYVIIVIYYIFLMYNMLKHIIKVFIFGSLPSYISNLFPSLILYASTTAIFLLLVIINNVYFFILDRKEDIISKYVLSMVRVKATNGWSDQVIRLYVYIIITQYLKVLWMILMMTTYWYVVQRILLLKNL